MDSRKNTFPRYWLDLTPRQLDALLLRRRLPIALADQLRALVKEEKNALRSERIRHTVRMKLWNAVLYPARYEKHKVGLMLEKQIAGSPDDPDRAARIDALHYYHAVLRECVRRLESGRAHMNVELPKSDDYRDFIPDKIKAQVLLRFDAIPRTGRKRVAEPFGKPYRRPKTDGQGVRQSNLRGVPMFTLIARHDGIDRHFPAASYFDAVFLFDALSRVAARVEMWEGATLRQSYAAI